MNEFTKILDRIDLEGISAYFLYGAEPIAEITGTYEGRINTSYEEIYKKLESVFPDFDKKEEIVKDAIFDFAITHSDVYMQVGAIIGFQLYKILDLGYRGCEAGDLEKLIKRCEACKKEKD